MQGFYPRLVGRCSVEAFATGNISGAQAADLAANVEALLVRAWFELFPHSRRFGCGWPCLLLTVRQWLIP